MACTLTLSDETGVDQGGPIRRSQSRNPVQVRSWQSNLQLPPAARPRRRAGRLLAQLRDRRKPVCVVGNSQSQTTARTLLHTPGAQAEAITAMAASTIHGRCGSCLQAINPVAMDDPVQIINASQSSPSQ